MAKSAAGLLVVLAITATAQDQRPFHTEANLRSRRRVPHAARCANLGS
jgi:hypothetical protein